MKKLLLIAAGIVSFGSIQKSNAGIYIEPAINFIVSGEAKDKGSSEKSDLSGTQFGARLGMSFVSFAFGVDYTMGGVKDKDDTSTTDFDTTELGAFFRMGLPMIHFYGAYIFDAKAEASKESPSYEAKGSGYKFGVGYTGLPFVAINVEYKAINFDEIDLPATTLDRDSSQISVGVSLPLSL